MAARLQPYGLEDVYPLVSPPAFIRDRASWQRAADESLVSWRERVHKQWVTHVGPLPDKVYRRARMMPYLTVAVLKEHASALDLLDEILGVPMWAPKGKVKGRRNGALRWREYVAAAEPTKNEFIAEVEKKMANPHVRSVKIRFHTEDGQGGLYPSFRMIAKATKKKGDTRAQLRRMERRRDILAEAQKKAVADYEKLFGLRMEQWELEDEIAVEKAKLASYKEQILKEEIVEKKHGSDVLEEEAELDTAWMEVYWVVQRQAGAAGSNAYKVSMTNLYAMRDYTCADGDCVLACVRAVAPKTMKKNKTIRRELGLAKGAVGFPDLEVVARHFKVGIKVYIEATDVVEEFDDDPVNRFTGSHTHRCVWTVEPREGEPTANLYYAPGHFSHITEFREIPPTAYCPVTGDYKAHYTQSQIKERLREQGRSYIKGISEYHCELEKASASYKTRLLVFDFETVWGPERGGELRPYAVAWYDFDPLVDAISGALEPEVKYAFGLDRCAHDLIDYIADAPADVKYVLAGFNSSRFDNYLLARAAQSREMLTRVFATGNTLRGVWMGRHEAVDIARLCPGATLKQRCIDFKTDPVKVDGFDHALVQEEFLRGNLEQWCADNREKLEHYVKCDVLSTASLFVKLSGELKELIGVDVLKGEAQTIGGAAWTAYERSAKKEGRVKFPAPTEEIDAFFRKAIVGGRVQNFKKSGHTIRGKLRMVDVASLYPTVMYGKNRHLMPPALKYGCFPKGSPTATDVYMPGKIGFYNVRVRRQPARNILPRRMDDGRLDWRYQGEFDAVASQCSIELIRRHGGEVEVGSGYYFPCKDDKAFHTFLEPIFAAKDEEDRLASTKDPSANASRRNMAKLLMNSLSGKTAQRNFDERVVLATGAAKQLSEESKMRDSIATWIPLCGDTCILIGLKPLSKVYNQRTAKPSYMAALIYEYSRAYMYELLLSKYDVQYMDTDSAVMTAEEYDRFRSDYPELDFKGEKRPKQLGDLEEELGHPEDATAILLGPKEYLIYDHAKKESKARLKGVNLGRDRLLANEQLPHGTLALHRLHERLPLTTPLGLFEALASGQKQQLLCSQLQRSLVSRDGALFSLRQRYLMKTLEPRKVHDAEVPAMRSEIYRGGP